MGKIAAGFGVRWLIVTIWYVCGVSW